MIKTESKFNLKNILTLILVLCMIFALALTTACKSDDEESSSEESSSASESTSETKTDEQVLNNGDFEYYTDSSSFTSPITSSIKWTRSYQDSTLTSSYSSGIIDTGDKYSSLGTNHKPKIDENDYFNPYTPNYNKDTKSFGEDNADTEADESGSKVLMIHNATSDDFGTAQYFTSSSTIALNSDSYAVLSVWVLTHDLKNYDNTQNPDYKEFGAFIEVVSSASDNPIRIENIKTEDAWVKYTVYLQPSATKNTTFTLKLGLGKGTATAKEHLCKGFAYFDNAEWSVITKGKYAEASATEKDGYDEDAVKFGNDDKTVRVSYNRPALSTVTFSLNVPTATGVTTNNSDKVKIDFSDKKIGSSYTFHVNPSELAGADYSDKENPVMHYVKISFLAKVSVKETYMKKATVTLVDGANDSVSFDNFETESVENKVEALEDFVRYTFYVTTNYNSAMSYNVRFTFGAKAGDTSVTNLDYPVGTAEFKDITVEEIDKDAYDTADMTNAKKASLIGNYTSDYVPDDDDESETSDSYSINVVAGNKVEMAERLVTLNNVTSDTYKIVSKDESALVGVGNSQYADKYGTDIQNAFAHFNNYSANRTNAYVQPIVIQGKATVKGVDVSLSADTIYQFGAKVYAYGEAKAFINIARIGKYAEGSSDEATLKFALTNDDMKVEIVNNASVNKDGYVNAMIIIKTKDAMTVRLEFGNSASNGVVLVDEITNGTTATAYTSASEVKNAYPYMTFTEKKDAENKVYYFRTEDDAKEYVDASADKKDSVLNDKALKDSDDNIRYYVKSPEVVALLGTVEEDGKTNGNFVQYYRYDTEKLYEIEPEEETEEESESEETEETTPTTQIWLELVSVLLAVALIIALVAIIVRKSMEKKAKKKSKTQSYYKGYNRNVGKAYSHKGQKVKSNIQAPDKEDAEKDYDYDNPDNN